MKKRLLSLVLCLVMVFTLVPFSALAEGETPQATDPNAVAEEKTNLTPGEMTTDSMVTNKWVDEHDGQYDITMTSYATGGTMTQELESDVPLDIVLVIDQSGSMKYDDISAGFTAQNGPWTADQAIGWYHKVGDNYYEVRATRGEVFTPTVRPRLSDNLMGVTGESLHMSWNSWQTPYSVMDQSGNLVPLYVRTIGYPLGYDAQFYYYENGTATLINFTNGSDTASYSRGGIGTGSMDSNSYRLDTTVYKSSTGYKQLYYVDANGNELGTFGNAVTVTSDSAWDGPLYYNSNQTRLQALQQAAQKFLTLVGEKADAGNVDHRVAIAGFASNIFPGASTTKNDIVTGSNQYNYVNTGLFIQQTNGAITFDNFQVIYDSDSNRFSQVTSGPVVDTTPYYYSTNGSRFYPMRKIGNNWYYYRWNSSNELYGTSLNITNAINNGYVYEPRTYGLTQEDYQNALVNVRSGDDNGNHVNDFLDTAINNLNAYGGTYVSYGIAMANNVFANNDNVIHNADGTTTERKRVIVVFTDGEPGANGFDEAVANEALNNAAISKETYGASVYTIGLFVDNPGSETGETAVDPRARTFIHQLSSEYYTSLEKVYKEDLDVNSTYYAHDKNGMVYAASTTAPDNTSLLCGWHLDYDENYQLKYDEIYRYPLINRSDTNSGRAQFYSRSGNSYNEIWVQAQRWTEWFTTYSTPAMSQNTVYYSYRNNQYQPFYYAYRWNNYEGTMYDPIARGAQDPYATKLTQFYSIKSTTPTNKGTYAFEKADAAGLASAFQTISESIQTPYTTVSLTKQNSYFADTITKEFTVPANAQATLSVQRMAYDAVSGKINPVAEDDAARANAIVAGLTQTWTTNTDGSKTLKVEGFDYSENYVAEGHPGYQLIVKINNLTTTALGKLYTNDSNSGVFKEGTLVAPLPMPYVITEADPVSYVVDFNAKMNIADEGRFQLDVTSVDGSKGNGTFFKNAAANAAGTISYQLKAGDMLSDGANLVMSGADTAIIQGKFYEKNEQGQMVASASAASWKTVTVVPASSVYFDDSFRGDASADPAVEETVLTVGTGSGYNAGVPTTTTTSGIGAEGTGGNIEIRFTGSRIDVYCTTTSEGKSVTANVKSVNPDGTVGAIVNDVNNNACNIVMKNQSVDQAPRLNVPTVSFDMGTVGTYVLTLKDYYSGAYKLDGVRVYNPVGDDQTATSQYADDEQNPKFLKLRDMLVNDLEAQVTAYEAAKAAYEENPEGDEPVPPSAVAFFTDKGSGLAIAEYIKAGPKNEIYLDPGEAIGFEIVGYQNYPTGNKVMLGLSVQGDTSGQVTINNAATPETISHTTDMYYRVYPTAVENSANGALLIANPANSGVRIAITNLKVSGVPANTDVSVSYDASALSVDETAEFEPQIVVTQSLMSFAQNPVSAQPAQPDQPEQPSDPEPTPGIADMIRQLISSFVSALFGSIARLFGH